MTACCAAAAEQGLDFGSGLAILAPLVGGWQILVAAWPLAISPSFRSTQQQRTNFWDVTVGSGNPTRAENYRSFSRTCLGWQQQVDVLAVVFQSLPRLRTDERGNLARHYGQPGAIEYFGPSYACRAHPAPTTTISAGSARTIDRRSGQSPYGSSRNCGRSFNQSSWPATIPQRVRHIPRNNVPCTLPANQTTLQKSGHSEFYGLS